MPGKLDFRQAFPDYYGADAQPRLARFGVVPYLAIEGRGVPGGPAFQEAVGALYAVAYALKFAAKADGADFTVPALEAQWWTHDGRGRERPKEAWTWRLLVRVPATVRAAGVAAAAKAAAAKGPAAAQRVGLVRLDEGDCVQALHVGPYDREGATLRRLERHAEGIGLRHVGPHHEIYLNDPRRVAPSKVKTILRWPVAAA